MNSLHFICLVHGLEVRRPEIVIQSLMSVIERIIADDPEEYLLFLQDAFPYLEKYLVTDYLPKLVDRIAFIMEQHQLNTSRDKALLLDYKAELFVLRKEHANALKKIKEATEALKKAFEIRKKYEHLGLMESHDTLQQMVNLTNMLIIGNELPQARKLLSLYESLVSEYESEDCLDYGFCQTMFGILCIQEKKPVEAERYLLSAETIITNVIGTDKYKGKYLEADQRQYNKLCVNLLNLIKIYSQC